MIGPSLNGKECCIIHLVSDRTFLAPRLRRSLSGGLKHFFLPSSSNIKCRIRNGTRDERTPGREENVAEIAPLCRHSFASPRD